MASSLKLQRQIEKEIVQLASGLRGTTKCKRLSLSSDANELEIVMEAICVTAFASMTVYTGVGVLSAAASSTKMTSAKQSLKRLAINTSLKKRNTDVEKDL